MNFNLFLEFFYLFFNSMSVVVEGLRMTLLITISGFIVGQVLALPIGLALCSKFSILRLTASAYTFVMRGSPLLVQLFIVYAGIGRSDFVQSTFLKDIFNNREFCAILAIGLNSAAYMAEVVAGAIRKVPQGQTEAGFSLALPVRSRLFDIVLPQAYRALLPQISNEMILVLKGSSLVAAITLVDIMESARIFAMNNNTPFETYTAAGILYLVLGIIISILFKYLEHLFPTAPVSRNRKELKTVS